MPDASIRQAPTLAVGAPPEPSNVAVAVRVARLLLADYGDSRRDGFTYPEAYGALAEALRLLLRAVDAPHEEKGHARPVAPDGVQRCPAAHPEDPTPCDGPPVVTVLDADNAGADGCEHHAARLLASLDGGRVYPLPDAPDGAAIRVFKAADGIRPFCWYENAPRTRSDALSRTEQRERGEQQ